MIYRRRFDAQGSDSLAKLARWVRPGSRVLELGAASGYFTAFLRSQGCEVDIVEVDPAAAHEAAQHARRTLIADLDGDRWSEDLGDARYDAIVCADVLEHLRDGARLLRRLREHLAPDGELMLSVPNIAHSAVIANLVDERFDYGGEGLLDPTHLRLYTWRSLADVLAATGYAAIEWDCTLVELFDTEFRVRGEGLAPALRDALMQRANASVYQWLVRATTRAQQGSETPPAVATGQHVPVRLLYAASPEALSLDRAIVAPLPIGGGETALEWRVPERWPALRLLLADRVGVVQVRELRLHAGDRVLWSSLDHAEPFAMSPFAVPLGGGAFALVQPDAWIAPAAAPDVIAQADSMSATLAWPASAAQAGDFAALTALAEALQRRTAGAQRTHDELVARQFRLDEELRAHAETRAELERTRHALSRRDADVASLEQSLDAFRAENARLDAALAAQDRIITYRQSLRWWIKLPIVRAKWWWHRMTDR